MKKPILPTTVDVAIIGSGLGGLTAGAILARKGKKVVVFEKHSAPGGYANCFSRKGFKFDISLHQMGGIQKTFFKTILEECGVFNQIEFIKAPLLYESIFPDFKLKVLNGDVKSHIKDLIHHFPQEKKGIQKWFGFIKTFGREIAIWDNLYGHRYLFPIGMFFAPLLFPHLIFAHKTELQSFLDHCTKNKILQTILLDLLLYFDNSSHISYLNFLAGIYGYYFDGGYYIKGGSQQLTHALVNVILSNNGQLFTSCEVDEILTSGQKAIGIKTKDEQTVYADKIISNADPFITYQPLLRHWSATNIISKINQMKIGPSISQIYLGLNTKIQTLYPQFKDSYILNLHPLKTDQPLYQNLSLVFHSNVDPSNVPPHKSSLCIVFLDSYARWCDLSKEAYHKKKQEELDLILDLLEPTFPQLRHYIEVMEFATPLTMKKFTNNTQGAVYGFSHKIGQRRIDQLKNPKNLYFASAWGRFGGGFEGAMRSGYFVAEKLL